MTALQQEETSMQAKGNFLHHSIIFSFHFTLRKNQYTSSYFFTFFLGRRAPSNGIKGGELESSTRRNPIICHKRNRSTATA